MPDGESSGDRRRLEKQPDDISQALTGTFSKKLAILQEAIEEINKELDTRLEISRGFDEEIDCKIEKLEFELKELKSWWLGHNMQAVELRRRGLEQDLLTLKKEKRSESLRAWEDIDALKKRRRELLMEYQHLINTKQMVE
jgi:hypothetical protein